MENTGINWWKDIFGKGDTSNNIHEDKLLEIRYKIRIYIYALRSPIRIIYQYKHISRIKPQRLTYKNNNYS